MARSLASSPIPARAGIGLRAPHHREVLATRPDVAWFEVHSENFFGAGGDAQHMLLHVRENYPVSLHGVGLSLGNAARLDLAHLAELKQLIDAVEPGLVSEHLCWGAVGERHLNDLLPLPYTEESLQLMIRRIDATQAALGRDLLVENVSSYLQFSHSTIPEWEFVAALAQCTGCGILCDVNNIYVSAVNHGFDASGYLRALPAGHVREIHLAGFTARENLPVPLLIDTHGAAVAEPVWRLYEEAITLFGAVPTLIEWDRDIPGLTTLMSEAQKAEAILSHVLEDAA